jgi:glucose/arabinose dehydrogenase
VAPKSAGPSSRASTPATSTPAPAPSRPAPKGFAWVTVNVPKANATGPLSTSHELQVPTGWRAEAWARVPGARLEVWTPQHNLLVSQSAPGKVTELIPGASAGSPPAQRVLISGLNEPQGMAFDTFDGHEVLYIAQEDELDRYVWTASGTLGARTVIVTSLLNPKNPGNHFAKTLLIAPDHTIYMTGGSASNASPSDFKIRPPRAVIFAVNPQTHALKVFATGVRNGEGLAFAPDGSLWTAVNERDNIPYPFHQAYGGDPDAYGKVIQSYVNNHPPDELAHLTQGRNLGWPYCDPDPDVNPGKANSPLKYSNLSFADNAATNPGGRNLDCAKLAPINYGLPAHSAPVGFHFLENSTISQPWRGGAVVAVHGSWDRKPQRGPAVLWLAWDAKTQNFSATVTLISGFQTTSAGARWGRTVDALPGADGDLYVSDDMSGTIYRVGPSA